MTGLRRPAVLTPGTRRAPKRRTAAVRANREGHERCAHRICGLRRPRTADDLAVGAVGEEEGHVAPTQPRPDDEAVEGAELPSSTEYGVERFHQARAVPDRVEDARFRQRCIDTETDVVHIGIGP